MFYKSSGVWQKLQDIWYKDAGTWKRLKAAWYKDAGVWKQIYLGAGPVSNMVGGIVQMFTVAPNVARAGWRFNTNGTVDKKIGAGFYFDQLWFDPATTGTGSSYYMRATKTAGSASIANNGVWQHLSNAVLVELVGSPGDGYLDVTFDVDVAETAGGPIVGTGTFGIAVESAV